VRKGRWNDALGHIRSHSGTRRGARAFACRRHHRGYGSEDLRVTQPDPTARPPTPIDPSAQPAGLDWRWYGNHYVWTQLPPDSTVLVAGSDGHLPSVKWPWRRMRRGKLSIRGHPVGASRPRLSGSIPDGYGSRGFQATGLIFPSYGCWRVIGSVRRKSISFVVQVKASQP